MKKAGVAILGMLVILANARILAAQTVTPGYLPLKEDLGAVRYRSFGNTGGDEIYLGIPDLGVAGNRTARNFGFQKWGATNDVTFTYDPAGNRLLASVNTGSAIFSLAYPNFSVQLPLKGKTHGPGDMDIMHLSVVCRDAGTTVSFNDVYLNGQFLGNFTATGWSDWIVTDYDFSQAFTLTGRIVLSGTFPTSQENSKVEVKVGALLCWDQDGDGYGDPASSHCNNPLLDCDDTNLNVNPAAPELCNDIDDNCDGSVDEDFDVGTPCTVGLGICETGGTRVCTVDGLDSECDAVPGIPGTEGPFNDPTCGDSLDNDCDGTLDAGDTDCGGSPTGWSPGGETAEASVLEASSPVSPKTYNPFLALFLVPAGVIFVLKALGKRAGRFFPGH